jgi:hypothetical protein
MSNVNLINKNIEILISNRRKNLIILNTENEIHRLMISGSGDGCECVRTSVDVQDAGLLKP